MERAPMAKRRIDRITDPAYLEGVAGMPTAEVRALRIEAAEEEADLSYERRLLHGRISIMQAELARRQGEGGETSLVDRLTEILSDDRPSSRGSFAQTDAKISYTTPHRKVSKLLADDTLARLPDLSEEEIRSRLTVLEDAEHEISTTRRRVQGVLDRLSGELAARYRSGDANPDEALIG